MSGLFATNLRNVAVKEEAVSGIAEPIDSVDYDIRFQEADLSTLEVSFADDGSYVNGQLTKDAQTPGIVRGGMTLKSNAAMAECTVTGTAGDPLTYIYTPNFPLEKALAMSGVRSVFVEPTGLLPSERGYFKLWSDKNSLCNTATLALLDVQSCSDTETKGIEYKLRGCSSNLVVSADEAGVPFSFNFDPQGGVESVEEVIHADLPTFNDAGANDTRSIPFMNADIVITPVNYDGSDIVPPVTPATFCLSTFSLDFQNQIAEIICASSQFGLTKTAITDQAPKLDVSMLMTALGEFDWFKAQTGTQIFTISVIVYEDGAKTLPLFGISIPRGQMVTTTNEDNNGFRNLSTSFMALVNTQGTTEEFKQQDVVLTLYAKTIDLTA